MKTQTGIYAQVHKYLRKGSEFVDQRHLKVLSWMVTALLGSQSLNQNEWEAYVESRAQQAQSYQRRWSRFLSNRRVEVEKLYVPLVLGAIEAWKVERLYVALDTTMLWNKYCLIYLSVVCAGRAIPLMWMGLEHKSASVAFEKYQPLLERAQEKLFEFADVMLLADRGFANHDMVRWLKQSSWHWCIRLPSDTAIYGVRRRGFGYEVRELYPPKGEARFYHHVRLWEDAQLECHLALASVRGIKEQWAIITDEPPTLETFWQYGLRFRIEQLFLDSKSGVFDLEGSRVRDVQCLEHLYLAVAIAILFATLTGLAVQKAGFRRQVDAHWKRGLSYLKMGLRWLKGSIHKARPLVRLDSLLYHDPAPCFASAKARDAFYRQFAFSRVQDFYCSI